MLGKPKPYRGKSLKGYEATNVLFMFFFVAALGLFVAWVFLTFRSPNRPPEPEDRPEIVEETITPEGDACIFHLGTTISQQSHIYRSPLDIPVTDDGLVRRLFELPGVAEIVVEPRMIMLRSRTAGIWGTVQPQAREIINNHIHIHP